MRHRRVLKFEDACGEIGVERSLLIEFIQRRWIAPALPTESKELTEPTEPNDEKAEVPWELDDEDLSRVRLILELRRDFGVNDEAVPLILHLLDQVHAMRSLLKKLAEDRKRAL